MSIDEGEKVRVNTWKFQKPDGASIVLNRSN